MTFAWYGHLRFKEQPLRPRHRRLLAHRLLRVLPRRAGQPLRQRGLFGGAAQDHPGGDHAVGVRVFSALYLKEPIGLNQVIGFALIALGAFFVFSGGLKRLMSRIRTARRGSSGDPWPRHALPWSRAPTAASGSRSCKQLSRAGLMAVLASRDLAKGTSAAAKLASEGLEPPVVALDVTDEASIRAAVDEVLRLFGRIDVLVNNAGILQGGLHRRGHERARGARPISSMRDLSRPTRSGRCA